VALKKVRMENEKEGVGDERRCVSASELRTWVFLCV
jgi:hypothetical protein